VIISRNYDEGIFSQKHRLFLLLTTGSKTHLGGRKFNTEGPGDVKKQKTGHKKNGKSRKIIVKAARSLSTAWSPRAFDAKGNSERKQTLKKSGGTQGRAGTAGRKDVSLTQIISTPTYP